MVRGLYQGFGQKNHQACLPANTPPYGHQKYQCVLHFPVQDNPCGSVRSRYIQVLPVRVYLAFPCVHQVLSSNASSYYFLQIFPHLAAMLPNFRCILYHQELPLCQMSYPNRSISYKKAENDAMAIHLPIKLLHL